FSLFQLFDILFFNTPVHFPLLTYFLFHRIWSLGGSRIFHYCLSLLRLRRRG
ncbi:hypothetical protein BYT27DRAFT_7186891, partial [Phlegmacium glaucopus]